MEDLVDALVQAGMAYSNLTAKLSSVLLIVPGPANQNLDSQLIHVPWNLYKIQPHFSMLPLENEMTRLPESGYYANFG